MIPRHYLVRLEPDLKALTFSGFTVITIDAPESVEKVIINVKELTIGKCQLELASSSEDCLFSENKEAEELEITLPSPVTGTFAIRVSFDGVLNDMLYGFYRSKYQVDGEDRYMATTQFEERDARAAFPCFDHPAKKAEFDIEFVINDDLQAISNTEIKEEQPLENGKKLIKFETTPPMSTYLLYFGVGEFEFLEDTSKSPKIRVATTPGKIQYGKFALDMGRKSIDFGEEFTGVKFPLSKCDHIAVADFAAGAMENFGAITYRENALLVYPGKTSKPTLVRIGSVIAHETAHMWFGDIVSPAEWKYVWLNESFASYFTSAIPDRYFPDWNMWEEFTRDTYEALIRDGLKFTVPIELPGAEGEPNIDASNAPIIYNKGAAVIRVLEGYLGADKFKEGVKAFLNQYKFKAATSQDYWEAFEEATGDPIQEFAQSWVFQKGYPYLAAKRTGNKLQISQKRFTYLELEDETLWLIPLKLWIQNENGEIETKNFTFNTREFEIELPENTKYFMLNADQTGYYRVHYDTQSWIQIGELIRDKKIPAINRYGILEDIFALTDKGELSISFTLDFIKSYCSQETETFPISAIVGFLSKSYRLVENHRDRIKEAGRIFIKNALDLFGMNPKEEDSVQVASLRNGLIWLGYRFDLESTKDFGKEKFQAHLDGTPIHPDIFGSIMNIAAATELASVDYFKAQIADPEVPMTHKLSMLSAMGCYPDEEIIRANLAWNLKEVPKNNRFSILVSSSRNLVTEKWFWDYFRDNIEVFMKEMPINLVGYSLSYICPYVGRKKPAEVNAFFDQVVKMEPRSKDTVDMAREYLELYGQISKM